MANPDSNQTPIADGPDTVYPSSDDDIPEVFGLWEEPAYSTFQQLVSAHYIDRKDVLVGGHSFIFYPWPEGGPCTEDGGWSRTWLDCFVAKGVDRESIIASGHYFTWKVGKSPDLALTVRPLVQTFELDRILRECAEMGIREHWTFDPNRRVIKTGLLGHHLTDGYYQAIQVAADKGGILQGQSAVLGLNIGWDAGQLRLINPANGTRLRY